VGNFLIQLADRSGLAAEKEGTGSFSRNRRGARGSCWDYSWVIELEDDPCHAIFNHTYG
jgi:hypothetical protein